MINVATTRASAKPKPKKGSYKVTKPTSVALRLVRPWIVDRVVRWARRNGVCERAEEALTLVFGTPPKDGWRDCDGYDCDGYDVDNLNVDGWDQFGRDVEGYNVSGYNKEGWNRAGVNAWGYMRGTNDVDELLKHLGAPARENLRRRLTEPETLPPVPTGSVYLERTS